MLGRIGDDDIVSLLRGHGWEPHVVTGDDPAVMHARFAQVLDECHARIRAIRAEARRPGVGPARATRPRWPAIVLRTPKGWTGPKVVDGLPVEGTFRAHQVPVDRVREDPAHLALLEAWMRSYRPEELFDERGMSPRRAGRARAHRRPPARRESPRQRRPRAPAARPAGLRRLRPAGAAAGHRAARLDPPARQVHARHLHAQPRGGQLPPLLPGRDQLQPARRRVRGGAPLLRRFRSRATTITWRRTVA